MRIGNNDIVFNHYYLGKAKLSYFSDSRGDNVGDFWADEFGHRAFGSGSLFLTIPLAFIGSFSCFLKNSMLSIYNFNYYRRFRRITASFLFPSSTGTFMGSSSSRSSGTSSPRSNGSSSSYSFYLILFSWISMKGSLTETSRDCFFLNKEPFFIKVPSPPSTTGGVNLVFLILITIFSGVAY